MRPERVVLSLNPRHKQRHVTHEFLEPRTLLAAEVIISEIADDNRGELATRIRSSVEEIFDGVSLRPDWLEIYNASGQSLSLEGMHLTDDPGDARKWPFPSGARIDAGGFLVVFASGVDLRSTELDEQGYLHTNFRLNVDGEFLALTNSNGNIIHEYAPNFSADSGSTFGVTMHTETLVGAKTPLEYLIPVDESQQPSWRDANFDDPSWVKFNPNDSADRLVGPIGYQREAIVAHGEVVGPAVVVRDRAENTSGNLYVLDGHPFRVAGFVEQWSIYSVNKNTVTPLILNDEFEIIGVGKSRVSDGSGGQEFFFELQDGSAEIRPGYYLGFWDGGHGSNNRGVIQRTFNTYETIRWFGRGHKTVHVGQVLSKGTKLPRTFSIQASTLQELNLGVNTNVEAAMFNEATSLYVRYPFFVDERVEDITSLSLQIRYDDAVVVYLNGNEVDRRNYVGRPHYAGTSSEDRSSDELARPKNIDLSDHISELVLGRNVLAFHVFNDKADSSELVLDSRLNSVMLSDRNAVGNLLQPTPGSSNAPLSKGTIDDIAFSVERGFYDSPFQISLSTPGYSGTTIYFTKDGSLPDPSNSSSFVYEQLIEIPGTTTIRAIGFKEGYQTSPSVTHSYLFLEDVIQQPTLDRAITEHEVWGDQLIDSLRALPTISLTTDETIHTVHSLLESEVSVEWVQPDAQKGFQINAGVERFGGHSFGWSKSSLRLSFKDIYGPSTLAFDVFQQPGAAVEFDQLLLRSGSHDTMFWGSPTHWGRGAYIRNRWAFDRQLEMGHPAPRGRFVHVYINGAYWGQYHLMERPNASFMESYTGESEEGYDVLNAGEPINGDSVAWNALRESIDDGFAEVVQFLDVQNYVDYMLLQFYGGNSHDWGHLQNWMAARQRRFGAGFQFFSWDSDVIVRLPLMSDVIGRGGPGDLWNYNGGLKRFREVQELMAERASLFFLDGGMLTAERFRRDIEALASKIHLSMIAETARWGGPDYTPEHWEEAIAWIKDTYAPRRGVTRTDVLLKQLNAAGILPFPLAPPPRFWIDDRETTGGLLKEDRPLVMTSESGEIYYTRDGSDPMQNTPTFAFKMLLEEVPPVRVHIPMDDRLEKEWTQVDFDDTEWLAGFGGVGFEARSEFGGGLDIESQMRRHNATTYARFPFRIEQGNSGEVLKLDVTYDDGFVAYLNGIEVARANVPIQPAWNSNAILSRLPPDEGLIEEFDLNDFLHLLHAGENVLAIQLLNVTPANLDAFILPRLRLGTRVDTGASPQAVLYGGPIENIRDQNIRAQVLYRDSWSISTNASFSSRFNPVLISEIMYHPAAPTNAEITAGFDNADDFEFLEIANVSSTPVDLRDLQLVQLDMGNEIEGVAFDFSDPNRRTLAPGQRLVVVEDTEAFRFRYGDISIAGQWSGGLSNRNETLALAMAEQVIQQIQYDDGWHPITDGAGFSLDLLNTSQNIVNWSRAEIWQPTSTKGGSPGVAVGVRGDLGFNGSVDIQDIDLLMDAVASSNAPQHYDLNDDGTVSRLDLEELVLGILGTRFGDTNLDGAVDTDDFMRLAQNYAQQVNGWAQGDFDGDGEVNFNDFNLLSRAFTG